MNRTVSSDDLDRQKQAIAEPLIAVDVKRQIRCPYCHRMLMKGVIKAIEIKCPKCGEMLKFENPAIA